MEFAKERGDKIKKVSNKTLALPFDLIRIENIMSKSDMMRIDWYHRVYRE
ncbi:hypothetical protein [Clostridium tyrobutyricum]|nr:hypothetical protein [Clostridium tyrobutyricum]